MTREEVQKKDEELLKQFGTIDMYNDDDKNRVHISGFRPASGPLAKVQTDNTGALYLVIYLDPLSPIGAVIGRWIIPFVPHPDYHLNKSTLWIYPIDNDKARVEVHFKTWNESLEIDYEIIYGVQIGPGKFGIPHLRPLEQ